MLRKKAARNALLILFILLFSSPVYANFVPPPEGTPYGTIRIKADGSISVDKLSPNNIPLSRSGNSYILSGNINDYGFRIERDNVILDGAGFSIVAVNWYAPSVGVNLTGRIGVTVRNLGISGFSNAILLSDSKNNVLDGNRITKSEKDLSIVNGSVNNKIVSNTMTEATYEAPFMGGSIYIAASAGNTFRNNNVTNKERNYNQPSINKPNFWIECSNTTPISDLVQDIDASNTLDGKPMCYWVNQKDKAVPSDAGYVALVNCNNITVENLTLKDNGQGLLLAATTNSTIKDNMIKGNGHGILLLNSSGNTFRGNEITKNVYGVTFYSSDNTFLSNQFSENEREHVNFQNGYQNSMDASNAVNGVPLCYWVNQHDKTVPPDAGYVFLVNCSRISVQDLNISGQMKGLCLVSTSNSLIINNNLVDNEYGICLTNSQNNKIVKNRLSGNNENSLSISASDGNIVSENEVTLGLVGLNVANSTGNMFSRNNISNNNYTGVELFGSSGNRFFENRVESNGRAGIAMEYSSNNNLLVGNNIADNDFVTVDLNNAQNNTFYRNNFKIDIDVRNERSRTHQILDMWADVVVTSGFQTPSYNLWDNGLEGNYWSDYNGSDAGANGMGDTIYMVDTSMHDPPIIFGNKTYSSPRSVDTLDRDNHPYMAPLPTAFETQLTVIAPENRTYDSDEAQLTFAVSEESAQVFYSLDLQEERTARGNLTLSSLPKGSHNLLVWTNGTSGAPANFQIINFETTKETSTAQTPEVTPSPSESPAEKPETKNASDTTFPVLLAATVTVVALAAVAVVLVVFRRVLRTYR